MKNVRFISEFFCIFPFILERSFQLWENSYYYYNKVTIYWHVEKNIILIFYTSKDDGDKNVHSSEACIDQQRLADELQMSV